MPHWLIKSAVQRIISVLPRSDWWNEQFQTRVTRSLDLSPARFELRLNYCRRHLENFAKAAPATSPNFSALELGTGWYPVVPVGLYLCGAEAVWTFDIAPLLRRARVEQMLQLFVEYDRRGILSQWLPQARRERLARLHEVLAATTAADTAESMLEAMNIHARVADAQSTGLPDGSIDLFVSTSVLEYVPAAVLSNLLEEFRRLARPGAVMSHFINLLDEFCHFDRRIGPFNFLKYSGRQWRWLDSPLLRKNRLRVSDYRAAFNSAGWPLVGEDNESGWLEQLKSIRLAPEFQNYSQADLLVIRSWVTSRLAAR